MRKCTPPMLMQTNTTSWPLVCDACCHSRDDQPRLTRHAHSKQPCPLHQPTTRVPLDRTSSPCPLSRSRRQRPEGSHGVKYLRNPKSAQAKPGQEKRTALKEVGGQATREGHTFAWQVRPQPRVCGLFVLARRSVAPL